MHLSYNNMKKKWSRKSEYQEYEIIDSDMSEKYVYDIDILNLDNSNKEWHKCAFEI